MGQLARPELRRGGKGCYLPIVSGIRQQSNCGLRLLSLLFSQASLGIGAPNIMARIEAFFYTRGSVLAHLAPIVGMRDGEAFAVP